MKIELPYADTLVHANIDWAASVDTLTINDTPAAEDPVAALDAALEAPISQSDTLFDRVRRDDRVTVVVSDSFRRTAIDQLLPRLLGRLLATGVDKSRVSFLVATGVHRGPTREELRTILGDRVCGRFTVHVHDASDPALHTLVGTTSRGTPVEVNKHAVECDRLIVTGAVVMHYFGGFGGGRKALLPGICSANTIAHNHALNLDPSEDRLDPRVRIGALAGNPVAEDMLEGAKLIGADCMINTVLNAKGEIAEVFAGDLELAHHDACAFAERLFHVPLECKADLVVAASARTQNFVQTHKALYNAYQAMKPGGQIVLLAPCPEGLGGEKFEKWLRLKSPGAVISALRENSEINGQTALSTLEKAVSCTMVTEMPDEDVKCAWRRSRAGLGRRPRQGPRNPRCERRSCPGRPRDA